jgi:hypothetical protein
VFVVVVILAHRLVDSSARLEWRRFQRNGYFQAMDCRNAIVDGTCRPTPPPASSGCPPSFAALMQACWRHNPQERPSFDEIVPTIEAELAKLGTEKESRRKGLK